MSDVVRSDGLRSDLLRVENLTIDFGVHEGKLRAVDDVSFSIPQGGTLALVGESGSGKSVCSQAIMGLLPRNAVIPTGRILFDDPRTIGSPVDIARLDRTGPQMRAIRGGRISIIFQEPMTSLSALHTVGDQIGEAVELHGSPGSRLSEIHSLGDQIQEAAELSGKRMSRSEADALTFDMLRMVGFPDPKRALRTYPFELSGGLRQRAMIAMSLVCRPALLIADEPTTALDVTIQAQILQLIKDLQKELGMALLMITHDLGVVANMADDIVVMYRGKVVEAGDLHEIYRDPQHPYLKALLNAVPRFDMAPGERLVPIREITAATGHLLKEKPVAKPTPDFDPDAPLLEVRHLFKTYTVRKAETLLESLLGGGNARQIKAVNDVSFDVRRGECLGLVGESGCGKTTLSKILMRAINADAALKEAGGGIVYDDWGRKIDVLELQGDRLDRFRTKLQFIFQDPFGSLNPRMTVYDILVEPLVIHGIGDDAYRREMVSELLEMVGLDRRHLNRYPHSFSGGQRQRIGIARALALRPDMVICDEPVSALDVSIQAQILNLLKDLQSQLGLTYLFISHNLAVVDYIADRIAVMCAGRLVELAPSGELFRNPVHPYTKALLSAVPDPDPDRKLDLRALMEGKASVPALWPEPYTDTGEVPLDWVEIASGHFVRAAPGRI